MFDSYDLRAHNIRKFFRTQLASLGAQIDYVEYMMGLTIGTYHDIQSLGVDKLRNIYASTGLTMKSKTRTSKIDLIKEYTSKEADLWFVFLLGEPTQDKTSSSSKYQNCRGARQSS